MSVRVTPDGGSLALDAAAEERLRTRVERAIASARTGRKGPAAIASITVPVPGALDVSAAVLAARRTGDRFACLEQPDRESFAVGALGQAVVLESSGEARFADVASRARELGRTAFTDDPAEDPDRPPATGGRPR